MAIPYYKNIDIPYKLNEYINENEYVNLPINFDIKEDNYIRKNVYERDILNTNFCDYVEQVAEMKVGKVVMWHWRVTNPNIAHVDCDTKGQILPNAALNWAISSSYSSVQWYDVPFVNTVKNNNEADKNFNTPNVTSYIAVKNIDMNTKNDEWNNCGPAIINTSIPHMIYAPNTRVSFSLQFAGKFTFSTLLERFINVS